MFSGKKVHVFPLKCWPLFLRHVSVNGDGGEVLLQQQLGQSHAALHALHKDDYLHNTTAVTQPPQRMPLPPPPPPFFSHLATSLWQKNTMKNKHKNSNYTQTTRIHVWNRRESFISLKNTRITHAVCQLFVYLAATQCLTLQYSGQANYIKIKKQTTYFAVCFSHTWLWNRVNTVNVVWTGSPKQGYNNAKFDRPWLNSIWEKAHSTVKSENVNDLPRDQIYIVRENHNKDFDISGHSTDLPSTNHYINFFFFFFMQVKKAALMAISGPLTVSG